MTASQVIEARMREKNKQKATSIGKFSDSLIQMAEYLSMHNHNRTEVYSEYSIKQLFFYFEKVVKINNQNYITLASSQMIAAVTAATGNADAFKNFIKKLE